MKITIENIGENNIIKFKNATDEISISFYIEDNYMVFYTDKFTFEDFKTSVKEKYIEMGDKYGDIKLNIYDDKAIFELSNTEIGFITFVEFSNVDGEFEDSLLAAINGLELMASL